MNARITMTLMKRILLVNVIIIIFLGFKSLISLACLRFKKEYCIPFPLLRAHILCQQHDPKSKL